MARLSGEVEVTRVLQRLEHDPRASDELLALVYDELRRLASARLAAEPPGQTLQATALVHEAYLRLIRGDEMGWDGRGHFFGAAARAMQRILVDQARVRGALKRGGDRARLSLHHVDLAATADVDDAEMLALDGALERLEAIDPRKAAVVRLRYFAGLTVDHAAAALGLSRTTFKDEWTFARAWLRSEMSR